MFFQRIKTPGIAHVAYLLGSKGEAAVVDPRRDVDEYLQLAREQKLTIRYVLETHRQEDFVLGSAELARITGAKIVNGKHALFGHGDLRLGDGEGLSFGEFHIRALHTPGHTPESMCYAVRLTSVGDRPWAVFTGDTLFIGETGRTDLPDRTKTGENAGLLYDAVHAKLLPLGDQTLLFPAHGAGSVCGGNIAERDESTLGLERTYNPVFVQSRADFVASKVKERIPRPPYFSCMEELNLKGGVPLAKTANEVPVLQPKLFATHKDHGVVIDTRDPEAFAGGHIPGSYNIWAAGLSVFGGWVASADTRVFLVLPEPRDLGPALLALARIGVDHVQGVLAGGFDGWRNAGLPIARADTTSARELRDRSGAVRVLDVREDNEFEDAHVAGAAHMYVGYLERHARQIRPTPKHDDAIVVTCSVGHRAGLAVSVLARLGYKNVSNLLGGMTAWSALELPTAAGDEDSVTTPDIEGKRS